MKKKQCCCPAMKPTGKVNCVRIEPTKSDYPVGEFMMLNLDTDGKIRDQHGNEVILKGIKI